MKEQEYINAKELGSVSAIIKIFQDIIPANSIAISNEEYINTSKFLFEWQRRLYDVIKIDSEPVPVVDPNQLQIVMPNFGDTSSPPLEFEHLKTTRIHGQNIVAPILFANPSRPTKGIAVDVGCKGNPGKAEYRGVDIETGREIFHIRIPGLATNNSGEYLGAVHGLTYAMTKNDKYYKVYTDSKTAISWVRQKKCKTKYADNNPDQIKMIADAESFLKKYGGKVYFWDNRLFGETPADLSGKKGVPLNIKKHE